MTAYFCCDERRREAVRRSAGLNGIDFLEVVDSDAPTPAERQRSLRVHFLKTPPPAGIVVDNIQITGGERITDVHADTPPRYENDTVVVHVSTPGDFATYTLRLVQADGSGKPLDGLDPLLAAIDFSFKVECHSDFDCGAARVCPPEPPSQPEIDYLAKDYASFRQLMLDRLAVLVPEWTERNVADLGIALVEILAYVGDYLSYQQDAVATEAYLGTARRRVSVRRHARLVDYFMHDGSNARVWVHVEVSADSVALPKGTQLFTRLERQAVRFAPGSPEHAQALAQHPEIFETKHDCLFFQAHNEIHFYTWGDEACCLPMGAMRATLQGHFSKLAAGDVLIFEESRGPQTGNKEDANPTRRHAIRLTKVEHADPAGTPLIDPLSNQPITEIEWAPDDALPFPFCVSSTMTTADGQQDLADVSVARGNIVLADHGVAIANEDLGEVPQPILFSVQPPAPDRCLEREPKPVAPRFRPRLSGLPLTFAVPYDTSNPPSSASATMNTSPQDALPEITSLTSQLNTKTATWQAQQDLLGSGPDATDFVAETETDGTTCLRFGDNQHALRPASGTRFTATYRVGNGVRGNVGAEAIGHIVSNEPGIQMVRNPLPAQGGIEPETPEHVRQNAPFAFRTQERAVTPDDYAAVTGRQPSVQRAAATFRWTGSWRTVFLTVDRLGGSPVDSAFKAQVRELVEPFRMAGHDAEIDGPRFVPLEIEMLVRVQPDYFRSDVKAALLRVFSNILMDDGRRGLFHPDNFTFGQPVYLSPLYAAAQAVAGVASVQITTFQRQGTAGVEALDKGRLDVGRLEIARLDNDPDFPERGVFRITLEGGK